MCALWGSKPCILFPVQSFPTFAQRPRGQKCPTKQKAGAAKEAFILCSPRLRALPTTTNCFQPSRKQAHFVSVEIVEKRKAPPFAGGASCALRAALAKQSGAVHAVPAARFAAACPPGPSLVSAHCTRSAGHCSPDCEVGPRVAEMRLKMGRHGASETPGFGKLLSEVFFTYAFGKGKNPWPKNR